MSDPRTSQLANLVRGHRLTAELSQQELAGRSGLSVRLISDLERGLRKLPRLETIRMLADGLALSSDSRAALFEAARPELQKNRDSFDLARLDMIPGSIPRANALPIPLSSLIGREAAVAHLVAELANGKHRLITLTGPGGVGKTRLALEAASIIEQQHALAVLFLPLAPIRDPGIVAPAIGRAFELRGVDVQTLPERLAVELAGRRLLVVLDNFEHILQAAPLIAQILQACPTLQTLVTSRTHLNLSAEHELPVAPLELPAENASQSEITRASAVRLFLERASLPSAAVTDDGAADIATICRHIDGLPLAIELAAAKLRMLTPADMLRRMDHALPMLEGGPRDVPARLQTMRNAVAWSYDLLSTEEQQLLRSLSVFQGGITLEAAEGVSPSSLATSVLPLFQSLANSSLIQRIESFTDSSRYTMLETVKEFGLDELDRHGEEHDARNRHLRWFFDQIGAFTPERLFSATFVRHIPLPDEESNLRVALNWALDQEDLDAAVRLAFGLRTYWRSNGFFQEAEAALDRIASHSDSLEPLTAAAVMNWVTNFTYQLGNLAKANALHTEGLRICRECSFSLGIRVHLRGLGMVTLWRDGPAALRMMTEATGIGETLGDRVDTAFDYYQRVFTCIVHGELDRAEDDLATLWAMLEEAPDVQPVRIYALISACWIAGLRGDYAQAERLGHEVMVLANERGIAECQQWAHRALGEVALARQQLTRAAKCYQEALRLVYRSSLRLWEGFCYANLAAVALRQGDRRRAALLYGAAEANWDQLGIVPAARGSIIAWSHNGSPPAEAMADEHFASAFAAGKLLSRAEGYAEAMSVGTPAATERGGSILSARQHEVLQLMADGHTNRQIAAALFVSERTIDGHVVSILSKLGVNSRWDAVTNAREQGLLAGTAIDSTP